jgi:hypothetical protein
VKVRLVAIVFGLVVALFVSSAFVFAVFFVGAPVEGTVIWNARAAGAAGLLVIYCIALALILFGAFVTARWSTPYSVLNTMVFGILSTIPSFLFIFWYPLWFTVLCVITIFPASVAVGYAVAARMV